MQLLLLSLILYLFQNLYLAGMVTIHSPAKNAVL